MSELLPTVSIQLDRQSAIDLQATLGGIKNGARKAITVGINKTLTTGRSIVVKRLAAEIELKQRQIRETIAIKKANFSTLEGRLVVTKAKLSLMDFKPIPKVPGRNKGKGAKGGGVSVKTRKGKPREMLKGTFIARMKSGHVGVYERRRMGGKGVGKRHARLPIQERFGPTPAGVLAKAPGVIQSVMNEVAPVLQKNILSQVDRLLKRPKSF